MVKKRSKLQKHLAKAVLAALVCTGGYSLISPSVAYADMVVSGSEMTLTNGITQDEALNMIDQAI